MLMKKKVLWKNPSVRYQKKCIVASENLKEYPAASDSDLETHISINDPLTRTVGSAFSVLLPKQVQFALFKPPWLAALIGESPLG